MEIRRVLNEKRSEISRSAARHGVSDVRIFGSVARGEEGPQSDVDFLVTLESGHTLLDLGGFLMDMQDLFGRKVDVVTEKSIHWYIRDRVLKEAVPL
jgi:uncharacterized protein